MHPGVLLIDLVSTDGNPPHKWIMDCIPRSTTPRHYFSSKPRVKTQNCVSVPVSEHLLLSWFLWTTYGTGIVINDNPMLHQVFKSADGVKSSQYWLKGERS